MTLLRSTEDGSADSSLFAENLRIFSSTKSVPGCGPTIAQRQQERGERSIEAAHQFGRDILTYGLGESSESSTAYLFPATNDVGWQPPTKKKRGNLFQKHLRAAKSGEMKVRKVRKINATKMQLTIASSERGKRNYMVNITNTPCFVASF